MNLLKKHILLLTTAFLVVFNVKAQLPNDECTAPQSLGSLNIPAACPLGVATPNVFNLTNVNSVAEYTWGTTTGCDPNGAASVTQTSDVWYSFVNEGLAIDITINGNIQNPQIYLLTGGTDACSASIFACASGSGGTVTLSANQMNVGEVYYLQISGTDALDQGTFTLTMQNSNGCDECLIASNLTVNPAPVNGKYQGGTTVTFCYSITQWSMINTNWLHGVVPTFGAGWDLSTLTTVAPPDCDGTGGEWVWFNNLNTNNGLPGHTNGIQTGFFFEGNNPDLLIIEPDGDPTNNYGDRCGTPEPGDPAASAPNWVFCWTITAKSCPPGQNNDDLGIVINTFGDGETGVWDDQGCTNDPAYVFLANLICCTPPVMAHTDLNCAGDNDGTATATGQGIGPFDYVWEDAGGTTIQTTNNVAGPNTVSGLAAGTYTVTVTDTDNGCITTGTVTVTEPTQLQLLIGTTPASCGQSDGTGTVTPQGGTGPYDFSWTDAGGTNIQTDNNLPGASTANGLAQGAYDIDVTDANGCTATVTINVQGGQGNLQAQLVEVPVTCPGFCDGSATLTVNGGTPPYTITWSANSGNQLGPTASNLCPDTYIVNYVDAGGCSGTTSATITEPDGPDAAITFSPWNANIFDPTVEFTDLSLGFPTQWLWQFDALGTSTQQNPTFVFPAVPDCYEVVLIVTDANNCPDSDTVQVCIQPTFAIYFPNAFTPNSDGTNTTFGGVGEGIKNYNMWIFNRWGEMIYFTDDISRQWDGRRKGEGDICLQDVYIYKAEVVDIFNQEHTYFGRVTLLK